MLHHPGQARAGPGEGERGHAAEAEPDCRQRPARLRAAGQGGQASPRPAGSQQRRVVARASRQAMTRSRFPATPGPNMSQASTVYPSAA